jgi:hypothetical protein
MQRAAGIGGKDAEEVRHGTAAEEADGLGRVNDLVNDPEYANLGLNQLFDFQSILGGVPSFL